MKDLSPLGNNLRYFEWSNQYPPPSVWLNLEMPAMTRGISEALPQLEEADAGILDVGVGGRKIIGLLETFGIDHRRIVGVDISQEILTLVSNKYPSVDLRNVDISDPVSMQKLSDRAPFQLITAHMVLNHLNDKQLGIALSNIFELLADGGSVVGMVPYPNNPSKTQDLQDSENGYKSQEIVPWGDIVTYHHRSFAAYHEYFELSGFYPTCSAFDKEATTYPNRLLIVARKDQAFKNALENLNLSTAQIDRHNYSPRHK